MNAFQITIGKTSYFKCRAVWFNPHSAGIDFSRQNLTSADVRFWRLYVNPRTVRVNIFIMAVDP